MKNTLYNLLIILPLIAVLCSCAGKDFGPNVKGPDSKTVIKKIELYQSSIKSVKGLARVKIKTADSKISYTQVTIASTPDKMRLEALNPFGNTVGFISSDGVNIYIISQSGQGVYDAGEEFYLSYVYPGFDLSITAESLVSLILGKLPYTVFYPGVKTELKPDGEFLALTTKSKVTSGQPVGQNGGVNTVWVNRDNYRVERAHILLQNGDTARIDYEYFEGLKDGYYFPKVIDFKAGALAISITYEDDIDINTEVDESLFRPVLLL